MKKWLNVLKWMSQESQIKMREHTWSKTYFLPALFIYISHHEKAIVFWIKKSLISQVTLCCNLHCFFYLKTFKCSTCKIFYFAQHYHQNRRKKGRLKHSNCFQTLQTKIKFKPHLLHSVIIKMNPKLTHTRFPLFPSYACHYYFTSWAIA